jgi:hypothetical protein
MFLLFIDLHSTLWGNPEELSCWNQLLSLSRFWGLNISQPFNQSPCANTVCSRDLSTVQWGC